MPLEFKTRQHVLLLIHIEVTDGIVKKLISYLLTLPEITAYSLLYGRTLEQGQLLISSGK